MESTTPQLLRHLKQKWKQFHLLPEQTLAIGFSGGRDSSVLLALCAQTHPVEKLVALHVDHAMRPVQERALERVLVEQQCARWHVPLRIFEATSSLSTEVLARRFRFQCFERFLIENPGGTVLLAHHAQDQAETVLMRLLKGRSWTGLAGIPESRPGFLRPLLTVTPQQLQLCAVELGLIWSEDSTNQETRYLRNALRNEVLPLLTTRFPRAVESLVRFGEVWREMALPTSPDRTWNLEPSAARLPRSVWESWTPVRREAELLAVAQRWRPGTSVPRRSLEQLVKSLQQGGAGEAGRYQLRYDKSDLVWEMVAKVPAVQYFVQVPQGILTPFHGGEVRWVAELDSGNPPDVYVASWGSQLVRRWLRKKPLQAYAHLSYASCVFLLVDEHVHEVYDTSTGVLIWCETEPHYLKGTRIFSTLKVRSVYERR